MACWNTLREFGSDPSSRAGEFVKGSIESVSTAAGDLSGALPKWPKNGLRRQEPGQIPIRQKQSRNLFPSAFIRVHRGVIAG